MKTKTYVNFELQSAVDDKEVYEKVRSAGRVMTEISANGAPKILPKTMKLSTQRSVGVANTIPTYKITKQCNRAVQLSSLDKQRKARPRVTGKQSYFLFFIFGIFWYNEATSKYEFLLVCVGFNKKW